jgi:hypothetical protein
MGCRGWGESGGTYPFLFLRLTFGTRRRLILLGGIFVPLLTLYRTLFAPDTTSKAARVRAGRIRSNRRDNAVSPGCYTDPCWVDFMDRIV